MVFVFLNYFHGNFQLIFAAGKTSYFDLHCTYTNFGNVNIGYFIVLSDIFVLNSYNYAFVTPETF